MHLSYSKFIHQVISLSKAGELQAIEPYLLDCFQRIANNDPQALLSQSQAAQTLGIDPRTLEKWRQVGGGPRFIRISARCIRYRRANLIAFVDARVRRSTSETDTPQVQQYGPDGKYLGTSGAAQ